MQQEIICIPKFCDITGFGKYFNFDVFIQRFAIIYFKKNPLDSFLKLVKSKLSFLGAISQVQTGPLETPVYFL